MAKRFSFKVANMRNEQSFILYPYDGGDTIILQSDKRFARVNLKTGEGVINNKNKNYANSIDLVLGGISFNLPEETKIAIQKHLWENNGKDGNIGGVLSFQNKELFSN